MKKKVLLLVISLFLTIIFFVQANEISNVVTVTYESAECCFDAAGGTSQALTYSKLISPKVIYEGVEYDYYISYSDHGAWCTKVGAQDYGAGVGNSQESITGTYVEGRSDGTMYLLTESESDVTSKISAIMCLGDYNNYNKEETECGDVISSITLSKDLTSSGDCFVVRADNVVIDGNGYSIIGDGSGSGIYASGYDNIIIKNFNSITGFKTGIRMSDCINSEINNNMIDASAIQKKGIIVTQCPNILVESNSIDMNGDQSNGIEVHASPNSMVQINTVKSTYQGIYITGATHLGNSDNSQVIDNNVDLYNTANGIGISLSRYCNNCLVKNNEVESYKTGIYIHDLDEGATIDNNQINILGGNGRGIFVHEDTDSNIIQNNRIDMQNNAQSYGILIQSNDNTIHKNTINFLDNPSYSSSYGIAVREMIGWLEQADRKGNLISNNYIYSEANMITGILLRHATKNIVIDNEIKLSGEGLNSGGILLADANYNSIRSNEFSSDHDFDIYMSTIELLEPSYGDVPERDIGIVSNDGNVIENALIQDTILISTSNVFLTSIKDVDSTDFPIVDGKESVGTILYLSSFSNTPGFIDFELQYTDDQINGFNESSIALYYYDSSLEEWVLLDTQNKDIQNTKIRSGLVTFPFHNMINIHVGLFVDKLEESSTLCESDCTKGDNIAYFECEANEGCQDVQMRFLDPSGSGNAIADCDYKEIGKTYLYNLSYCIGSTLYENYTCSRNQGVSGDIIYVTPKRGSCELGCDNRSCVNEDEILPINSSCDNNNILICHTSMEDHEICVASSAVNSHIEHGDYLGVCEEVVEYELTDGLVLEYDFSDCNAEDNSDYNNDGSFIGSYECTEGKYGQGITFDGLTGCIKVPDSDSLDFIHEFSFMAWINSNQMPGKYYNEHGQYVNKHQRIMEKFDYHLFVRDEGEIQGLLAQGSTANNNYEMFFKKGASILNPNNWYHVTMTFDKSGHTLYLNGEIDGQLLVPDVVLNTNAYDLYLGCYGLGSYPWQHLNGSIDEVRFFNKSLTQEEIQTFMNLCNECDGDNSQDTLTDSENTTDSSDKNTDDKNSFPALNTNTGDCKNGLYLICHVEAGEHEQCIPSSALKAHLDHGDYQDNCAEEKKEIIRIDRIKAKESVVLKPKVDNVARLEFRTNKEYEDLVIEVKNRKLPPPETRQLRKKVVRYIVIEHSNISNEDIESSTLEFSVEDSWVKDNNYNPDEVVLAKFINDDWLDLKTTYLRTQEGFHYYEAYSNGLSTFAITIKGEEETKEEYEQNQINSELDDKINSGNNQEALVDNNRIDYSMIKIVILPIVLIFLVIAFFVSKTPKPLKKQPKKDEVDLKFHSLLEYVKECREKEMSDEDIIDDLKKAKWKEETIDKVMKHK